MIYREVTASDFVQWLNQDKDSSYHEYFSYEAAHALFDYLEQLSEEIENIEFDPIAWCVEYSEYDNVDDFNDNYFGKEYKKGSEYTLETLQDNTTVIECDNGHIVVRDF